MTDLSEAFALSPQQEAAWHLGAGPLTGEIDIAGPLEAARLEAALAAVTAGAEILRSRFPESGGRRLQAPLPAWAPELPRHDLRDDGDRERLAALDAALAASLPDPATAPPLAFALARLAPERHRLLVAASPLVADGPSLELLPGALARAYAGAAPWPGELLQYADVADWQNELLQAEESREARAFWRRLDPEGGARQALPFDPAPPRAPGASASRPLALPPDLFEAAAAVDAEPRDVLLAAWLLLLTRLSGRATGLVGLAADGRGYAELAGVPGPLARLLPLAVTPALDRPFAELPARLRRAREEAKGWQEGFSRLALPEGAVPAQAFDFAEAAAPLESAGLRWRLLERHGLPDAAAVALSLRSDGGLLRVRLDYDGRRHDAAQMDRLAGWLSTLLTAAAEDPQRPAGDLPLLGAAERRHLLVDFNATGRSYPAETPFHRLVEAVVARRPEAPAVEAADGCLSYAALEARANRLARRLLALGVRPGDRVGLQLPPSSDLPAAILAVLKAGAAFVPLDAIHPPARLAQMAEDAGIAALVVADATAQPPASPDAPLLDLAAEAESLAKLDGSPLAPRGDEGGEGGERLAYVLFTSGSTGRPKGVMVPHRGLVNYALWAAETYRVEEGAGAPVHSSIGFDLTVTALLVPLLGGGCLRLLPLDAGVGPLAGTLRPGADWSLVKLTPSHLQALAPLLPPGPLAGIARHLVVGGEALFGESLDAWRERAPETLVVNEYGPTETVVGCCVHIAAAGALEAGPMPIGRPLANTALYVLDDDLQPVPWGVAGELHIGGEGVALGYVGRPDLTAERFLPDPFAPGPGRRMYRSGDLVRLNDAGLLEYLGRRDEQVKLRGFRIETAEIEAVLGRHPAVRQAAAGLLEQRLVAWVVPEPGAGLDRDALTRHCAAWLPDYMLPGELVEIAALPLGPSGKLDRRALPAPGRAGGAPYRAPRDEAETLLAGIWAEVLKLERVGIDDDFFRLGGDSILSLQIVARAARAGLRLTPETAFRLRTIAEQVAAVREGAAPAAEEEGGPIEGPLPPTPLQAAFLAGPQEDADHDNQALLLVPREALAPAALEAAAAALERRHPLLRLRVEGEGLSVAPPAEGPRLHVVDLSGVADAALPEAVTAASAEVQRSLDRRAGPLWRPALLQLGPGRGQRLLLAIHHLAVDGVSWRVLLDDLAAALAQTARGETPDLGPPDPAPRRWAEALGRAARAGDLDTDAAWWLERDWSGIAPAAPNASGSSERLQRPLPQPLGRRLAAAEQPLALLLTALGLACREAQGGRGPAVELEGHGREAAALGLEFDLARSLGWFTSLYPLPLDLPADPLAALQQVRALLAGLPHSGLAPEALRRLAPERPAAARLAALPAPAVQLNYLGRFDLGESPFDFAAESPGPSRGPGRPQGRPLQLTVSLVGEGAFVEWLGSEAETNEHPHPDPLPKGEGERVSPSPPGRGVGVRVSSCALAPLAAAFEDQLAALLDLLAAAPALPLPLPGLDGVGLAALQTRYGAAGIDSVLPLSPLQQGMLFHALAEPGVGLYLDQSSWRLSGPLEPESFRALWDGLVARQPVLRTVFPATAATPLQVVLRRVEAPWRIEDWRDLAPEAQEERFEALRLAERAEGLDPARAPLLRFTLVRLDEARWRFLWTRHHLLLDGWSLGPLLRDLTGRGTTPAPAFADYLAWLARRDPGDSEIFWRARLQGVTAPTPIGGRSGTAPGPSRRRALRLEPAVESRLRAFARDAGLTPATLVTAAWGLLLARRSGEARVVVGVTLAGRPAELAGIENSVGLFINSLPLVLTLEEECPAADWLAAVQEELAALRGQQHASLVELQGWSGVPRGTPLFESLVVYENFPRDPLTEAPAGALRVEAVETFEQTNYPLTLVAGEDEGLLLELRWDSGRFGEAEIATLLEGLEALLRGFPEAGGRPLASLAAGRRPRPEPPRHRFEDLEPLPLLFRRQAEARPAAPALTHGGETLTYGELSARVNHLAGHLRARGVGPETPVGLCLRPSLELVTALLAILEAGGAYLPLDPAHPPERLRDTLADSGARLVVTEGSLAERLDGAAETLRLDAEAAAIAAQPTGPLGLELPPDALAYVIYTSGSTGRPKGCLVTHANVARLLRATEATFGFGPEGVWTLFHAAAFDFSVWEIWGALAYGGRLVVVDPATARDPAAFRRLLAEERVTVLNQTPSAFRALQEADARAAEPLALRRVIFGGEALQPDLLRGWLQRHPEVALTNMYGITETTVHVTLRAMTAADLEMPGSSPIGRPLDDLSLHLLDGGLRPVPDGQVGEIFVGGAGVARGYLGRPALTAERFLPDPFSDRPGARLYRSGDLARRREDGELEYLGRADQQLKVRGYRIEPGEVEARLREQPGVADAVVVGAGARAAGGFESLLAYLVPADPAAPPDPAALREALRGRLPEPLLPAAFVAVAAIPLTANGKLDRARLPAPDLLPPTARPLLLPRDAVELKLAGIWEELLQRRPVGVDEDFFELGGHSLLAVRLAGRIEQAFGRPLPLAALLEGRSIAALAERLRAEPAPAPAASPLLTLQPRGGRPPFFAVHPAGGSGLCYLRLALALGEEQPFHAFQAPGLESAEEPLDSIEAMAERYLTELRTVQPRGPFRLGGYSLGGAVAYEMARRLQAEGEEIALLALFDAPPHAPAEAATIDEAALLLRLLPDLVPGFAPPPLPGGGGEEERLTAVIEAVRAAGALPPGYGLPEVRRLTAVFRATLAALRRYRPPPAPLAATLFRAEGAGDDLGWGALARGGVTVVPVPGSHESMIAEPHVETLAAALRQALQGRA